LSTGGNDPRETPVARPNSEIRSVGAVSPMVTAMVRSFAASASPMRLPAG
jgi:hypothetical protein